MILFSKLGAIALIVIVIASSIFFYGRNYEKQAAIKEALHAVRTREAINNEISNLSSFDLCLAAGGLPEQCAIFLPRLDEATTSK